MTINYAILGILSCRPMTGYDVKKILQDSPFLYWSGNNNQVYKALMELLAEGLVSGEVVHQEGAPSKKVYSLTQPGLVHLKQLALTPPEAPELKKPFLVQLAWAGQATQGELLALLEQYEREVKGQLFIAQKSDALFAPDRTPREAALWSLIGENVAAFYATELDWIQRVRQTLAQYPDPDPAQTTMNAPESLRREEASMEYQAIEYNNLPMIYLPAEGHPIQSEQDGLDLISLCAQHGAHLLLIDGGRLSDDFLRLRTGVAGAVLQKFAQYNIRAAVVLDEKRVQGKFQDFLLESNRGSLFRAFTSLPEAKEWLAQAE